MKLGRFLTTLGIGALAGMLLAPKKGSELREELKDKGKETLDSAKEMTMEDYQKLISETIDSIKKTVDEFDVDDFKDSSLAKLNELKENHTVVHTKVSGIVNAGVIAYVEGIRGFIPASKLDINYVEDLNEWLMKDIDVHVITVDEADKKLVLSAKEIAMEKAAKENSKKAAKVSVGSVLTGVVESLTNYGAFIELPNGVSGLLHISQISDKHIKSPSSVLKQGQEVTVKVIGNENGKISLSIKALNDVAAEPDENEEFEEMETEAASTSLGSLLAGFKFDK